MPDQYSNTRRAEPILSELELYSEYRNCNRWSLIVGISKYQYQGWNLQYAHRDAEEFYKLLLTPNGGRFEERHICKLVNEQATTGKITQALRSFLQKPARDDLVIVYFACHGSPDPNRPDTLYLLTHDTDPADIAGTALPMREVRQAVTENLNAGKVVILADTCHSGGISGGGRRNATHNSTLMNRYLQELSRATKGLATFTSAEPRQAAQEGARWGGGHGVFTYYLLEGMRGAADRDRNGIITVGELFEYVRDCVKRDTDDRQHPLISSDGFDRFLPIAVAPNSNFSQSSGASQQTQNTQGSRSSAAGQPVQENLDITFKIALTIEEMSAGTEKHIVTEQGGITVKIPAGLSPGKQIRVRGKGRLDTSTQQRGDLYLLIAQCNSIRQEKPKQKTSLEEFEFQIPTIDGYNVSYRQGMAKYFVEDLGNGAALEMVAIPSGNFIMGRDHPNEERPQHRVTVQPFFMGKFVVTQAQWRAVAGMPKVDRALDPAPSKFKDDHRPVEQITWYEAVEFCERLSQKTGKLYRLPSEAEWEYACRAGTTSDFYCGDTITMNFAHYDYSKDGGISPPIKKLYRNHTIEVGSFPPNAFGLYDMHGNVWEWCADYWFANYQGAPIDGSASIAGGNKFYRMLRGGSWKDKVWDYCRSSTRLKSEPDSRNDGVGFRVVCGLA